MALVSREVASYPMQGAVKRPSVPTLSPHPAHFIVPLALSSSPIHSMTELLESHLPGRRWTFRNERCSFINTNQNAWIFRTVFGLRALKDSLVPNKTIAPLPDKIESLLNDEFYREMNKIEASASKLALSSNTIDFRILIFVDIAICKYKYV